MDACPCGSGAAYVDCCGPFHGGADPPTALQLMRARYCAFVRRDAAFLIRTSTPLDRARFDMTGLRASFALTWLGLEVIAHERGGADDSEGMVHFRARCRTRDGREVEHVERSRFVRDGGAWVYRDARG